MIVYRVEHTIAVDDRTHHACGPLADVDRFTDHRKRDGGRLARNAQKAVEWAMNGHWDTKPTPLVDPRLNGIDPEEICGVDSMENVRFWFEDSIPALKAAGFTINKYDVPDWACRVGGSGQILFRYSVAKLVDTEEKIDE